MPESSDRIAVVGMACRLPGAPDPGRLWEVVRDGVETISFFTVEELAAAGIPRERAEDPSYVRAKGAVAGVELFDAEFFGYTPREAELMDPQHRIFLECCWEACEHAGYDPRAYAGRIGVYGGCGFNSYLVVNLMSNPAVLSAAGLSARLFNDKDFLTTHASYKLDLRGPSVAVQSACSTALVAAHLACQALLEGECDMALAGGVTLSFPQRVGYGYQEGGILSPDGHCRAFDERAQGTVEGNGAGVVLLKRLEDALADGDTIHAVVCGSAINNDGAAKAGYTAPSVESQTQVIAEALALSGIDPETIGYVEAHGSGTPLGDPIEVEALTRAFRASTDRRGFCALGSVKTNLGHSDSAAGAASLIKTVLALEHRQIPPTLHFERPNPRIRFAESPFHVATRLADWPAGETPRRAGVNSLGIGGTNAHFVLEEAPPEASAAPSRPWQVLLLSARTVTALETQTANLRSHLEAHPELDLADVAHTLRVGRRPFRHRRALVCRSREEALTGLADPTRRLTAAAPDEVRPVSFLLPGIGDHYAGMAAGLYRDEPAFREALDCCAELLEPHVGLDIREVLYPEVLTPRPPLPSSAHAPAGRGGERKLDLRRLLTGPEEDDEATKRLQRTALAHPVVFAVEYALAQLWREWGIEPRAMLGYSLGEYVAACLAGVFSLPDALKLVAARARGIDALPESAMLAVPLPATEVEPLLAGYPQLALSAANGPALSIVGGAAEAVDGLARLLAERGVACRRMSTTHAFHTPAMEPIVPELLRILSQIDLRPPSIPFVSNVTGTWITAAEATDPAYWARHLCRTVRFADGLEALMAAGGDEPRPLLEVGPGQTLGTLARQHPRRPAGQAVVASLPDRRESVADQAMLLETLARLWLAGAAPDWAGFASRERRRRVPLPTYPFERRRYFIERAEGLPAGAEGRTVGLAHPPGAGGRAPLEDWFFAPVWERTPPEAPAAVDGRRWLLFLDSAGLGERLAGCFTARGAEVVRVVTGEGFAALEDDLYVVDPRRKEDYGALLKELQERDRLPGKIVHLWTVGSHPAGEGEIQDLGFYSLLWLSQALGELAPERRGRVHVAAVSNGVFEVVGGEPLVPEKAMLLGPCRVLPQEMPGVSAHAIDLVLPQDGGLDELAARLADELSRAGGAPESVVALRGRHRWVRRFRPVRLPRPEGPPARLPSGGVCLIAGGLGEAGLAVAEHLFKSAGAKLALLAAPDDPPRSKWAEWLSAHDAADEISRRLRRVLALEAAGCEVLVLSVDLTRPGRVAAAVAQARARFGRLDGVVHAAGEAGAGLMQWKTRDMAEAVLAPKVRGTIALAEAVAGAPLAFFVLFGSSAAATGGIGQADTTAAAAFLDAFAQARAAEPGAPFTPSIGWGFFRWQPVTASDPALAKQLRAGLETYGIGAGEAAEVLDRALAGPLPQVVVSTQDLGAVMAQIDAMTAASLAEGLAGHPEGLHPRPELPVPYTEPATDVERTIAAVWQEAFGIDRIGVHDNFFDLAGSSLLAIQIVSHLTAALGVDLPMAALLEAPTVAELAARVEALRRPTAPDEEEEMERILREIEALSAEEAEVRLARETETVEETKAT